MPGHRLPASRVAGQRGGAGAHDQRQRLRGAREDTIADRARGPAGSVSSGRAETILTCDFEVLRTQLPVIAGVEPQNWNDAFTRTGPDPANVRLSMAQGFELVLQACGIAGRPGLVAELVRHDRDMLAPAGTG